MDRDLMARKLKDGLFISAMMGVTNGMRLAQLAMHADMLQIGMFARDDVDHAARDIRFVLPGEDALYVNLLRPQVQAARGVMPDVIVGWNTAPGDYESAERFACIAADSGADLYEMNFSGGYGKLVKRQLIRAMAMTHNWSSLVQWIKGLVALQRIPIVAKFYAEMEHVDFPKLAEMLSGIGLFGIHLNVRGVDERRPNVEIVRTVRPRFDGVLLASGRVTTREHLQELLAAGADCVGVARGIAEDPLLIRKLAIIRR
jgi:tRNA-dihydrouridine synthase